MPGSNSRPNGQYSPVLACHNNIINNVLLIVHRVLYVIRGKQGREGGEGVTAGEPALPTSLWDMLYADFAGVALQSPEQLRIIMGVIVVVCAAFGPTVPEANTELMW